ncbi:hypothetical protein NQZ68_003427 [Dissostichus eleginoides]|nr:hypothetical protein NQZ68_003427 [Dissostichus eleginoides]
MTPPGVHVPRSVCQGSGQPTRQICAANSRLADSLKSVLPLQRSAVNIYIRPHLITTRARLTHIPLLLTCTHTLSTCIEWNRSTELHSSEATLRERWGGERER